MADGKKKKSGKKTGPDWGWILFIFVITMVISAAMSFISSRLLGNAGMAVSFLILICIVAIGNDFQSSLETTSLLKELGAKLVVSRASRDIHAKFLLRNGADEVLYPERQLASWAAIRYTSDHISDYVEIDKDYGIFEVEVPMNWFEKSIRDLDIRNKYNVNILGIKRDEKISMNVAPDTHLKPDDTIMVLGKFVDVQKCFHI